MERAAEPGGPPRTESRPDVGRIRPAISLSSVLLPAPFGPITARSEPGATVRLTSVRAIRRPYPAVTSSTMTDGSGAVDASADAATPRARGDAARDEIRSTMESTSATLLERPDDVVDVPAHQAEVCISRSRPKGIVVQRGDHGCYARFLGKRLR